MTVPSCLFDTEFKLLLVIVCSEYDCVSDNIRSQEKEKKVIKFIVYKKKIPLSKCLNLSDLMYLWLLSIKCYA